MGFEQAANYDMKADNLQIALSYGDERNVL